MLDARCGFCGKTAEGAHFGRLFRWPGGWRCVRCLRSEEEDAWRERRWMQGAPILRSGRDPWQNEWLASPELYHLLRERAASLGTPAGSLLGGELFECREGPALAWISPGGIIVAYPPFDGAGFGPGIGPEEEWREWIGHLLRSETLELGIARDRSSYGALVPPHPMALPILKWGQTGDWMAGLAGTTSHGADR